MSREYKPAANQKFRVADAQRWRRDELLQKLGMRNAMASHQAESHYEELHRRATEAGFFRTSRVKVHASLTQRYFSWETLVEGPRFSLLLCFGLLSVGFGMTAVAKPLWVTIALSLLSLACLAAVATVAFSCRQSTEVHELLLRDWTSPDIPDEVLQKAIIAQKMGFSSFEVHVPLNRMESKRADPVLTGYIDLKDLGLPSTIMYEIARW